MVQEIKVHAECYRCRQEFRFYNDLYANNTKIYYRVFSLDERYLRLCEECYIKLERFLWEEKV